MFLNKVNNKFFDSVVLKGPLVFHLIKNSLQEQSSEIPLVILPQAFIGDRWKIQSADRCSANETYLAFHIAVQ